ncbi:MULTISPECIES: hypothetical protein [Streptomyces]|uniref:hypothetical protein n=1 Tax=Streptomyces TaxID=1883 RepID=UPI000C27F031|nr:hypothetical protein [Streptomyces sp. CB02120-2]PJN19273.1 hypothetical protein CG724_11015 [Streptomyces sp. CB02120-2]
MSTPAAPAAPSTDPGAAPGQEPAADPAAPAAPPAPAPGGQDPASTIARLEADLAAARAEAGKGRITAKQQAADTARAELTAQLLGILDPSKAGQEATPEELTAQLTSAQAQARQTAVELAVYRTAREAGGDPDALLDSRRFADSLADIDPADADAVRAAVTAAVAANPKLSAAPVGPARSGVEFGAAPPVGVTPQQFAAMTYGARAALHESDPDTYRRLAGTQ